MSTTPDPVRGRRRRRLWAMVAVTTAVLGVFSWSLQTTLVTPMPSTLLLDRHGQPLGEVEGGFNDDRFGYWPLPWVLPMRLAVATIETEDRRFHEHAGVSPSSIARAIQQNLTARRRVSGASTIAMQVARLQSGRSRSFVSKLQEATEALILVHRFGHDDVLRHYLTLAPYGARVHGAERASRFYFDKPAADLSWLQASWLAGLPQQPTKLGPFVEGGLQRGLARAHRILRTLRERGYMTDDELATALSSDLGLVDRRPRPGSALHLSLRLADDVKRARAQAVAAHTAPPTTVTATLDLEVQSAVHQIVVDNVERARAAGATNGSAVVVDSSTGEVLAWVGSVDYFDTEHHGPIDYNRARRSPGSALKPFIYALALDPNRTTHSAVYTAATPLADTPMDIISDGGKSYLPQNLSRTFMGPMSVREALGNSRNIPALRVLASVGVPTALRFFEAAGVQHISWVPGHYGLGLALGNLHVSPEELARLYLVLRHHGATTPLHFSNLDSSVVSGIDNTSDVSASFQLLSPTAADLVTHILSDPAARRPSFAEGSPLDYDTAVAVKTGTSQGYRDGWTVAFSDRLLVVMWIGNHDWRRMNHIGGLAGTAEATHRVFDVVQPQLQRHVPLPLSASEPAHSERREVCALSGLLAGPDCPHRRTEVFLKGTAPSSSCAWHQRVQVDVRNGDLATAGCPARFVAVRSVVDLPVDYHRWARAQHLPLRPAHHSRLCGGGDDDDISITLTEPNDGVRYAFDPDTPPEYATIRLAADVTGTDDDVVFLVDDTPVAQVSYPYETRWTLTPGQHRIRAVLAQHRTASTAVGIAVHR